MQYSEYSEKRKEVARACARDWYYRNRDRRAEVHQTWLQRNPDYRKKYRINNLERILLTSARNHAKRDGVVFNLTIDDIVIPEVCPVFGTPLDRTGTSKNDGPSLDKVIPELGYVSGNVRVISWRANRLKHNMTLEEVQAIERYIKEHIEHNDHVTVRGDNHANEVLTY